jgi:hypothetical protein
MAEQAAVLFTAPTAPTQIGVIECDVLVEQEFTLASEVTEHPVEDGFPIADHVIRQPLKLSMVVAISNSPVTWYTRFGGNSPDLIPLVIAQFEQIYTDGEPVTIVTSTKIYKNMVMTEAKIPRNVENGKILKVPLEFTQIRKVVVKTTDIPSEYVDSLTTGKAGETEQDAGTATQTDIGDGSSSSSSDSSSSSSSDDTTTQTTAGKSKSILKGMFS